MLLASYQVEVESRHGRFVADEKTIRNCSEVAKFLVSGSPKFGLMLCGVCGNGKTTMLYAFRSVLNLLSDSGAFNERKSIRIIDAKQIQHVMKDEKAFNNLCTAEMVGIEDMGRESTELIDYGNRLNPVVDLLEYRYNNQLFTIITTNLVAEDIRKKYGDRIADRFNEMLTVVVFGNKSYRK